MAHTDLPPISALFLAKFDQKVGYTIAWKRSLEGIDLDGVEYQCFPSGLHSVSEDLVYFTNEQHTHQTTKDQCAGISAFVQEKADEQRRNAEFAAVGVLVRETSWLYAEGLRALAGNVVKAPEDLNGLEAFWEKHTRHSRAGGAREPKRMKSSSPGRSKRKREHSDAIAALQMEDIVPADHPSLSMPALLATFGPLVFPLHRALLLRKRILSLGTTPVQPICNLVHNLSILSTLPQHVLSKVNSSPASHRTKCLLNVGIFDIPRLKDQKNGYLACTTDDILGEKKDLYDLLIELPPSNPAPGATKLWPRLRTADGRELKATQRDFRRYGSLRREIRRLQSGHGGSGMQYRDDNSAIQDEADDAPLIQPLTAFRNDESETLQTIELEVVEPESWSSIAYRSLMYWASPTELEALEAEEALADQGLIEGLPELKDADNGEDLAEARNVATVLVTYFHRLTTVVLQTLAESADGSDEDEVVEISAEEARRLGIDTWSPGDRDFVQEATKLYYGREAVVSDEGLLVCGVRIC